MIRHWGRRPQCHHHRRYHLPVEMVIRDGFENTEKHIAGIGTDGGLDRPRPCGAKLLGR
jgi:hypothetical protein